MNSNVTVNAIFTQGYTITATAGTGGSIAPSDTVTVNHGTNKTFNINPNTGYHVTDVLVDGLSVGAVGIYTFMNVTADHTIAASFAANTANTYTITATAGIGGTISPSGGAVIVSQGANQTFNISADPSYQISDVLVDGGSVGAVNTYTFTNVTADHTITVSFTAIPIISASPSPLILGDVIVFRTGSNNVSISNTSMANLVISSIEIIGSNAFMFQATNWTGAMTIGPGLNGSLNIAFNPVSRGAKAATLRLHSNDPVTPALDVPLSGTGL